MYPSDVLRFRFETDGEHFDDKIVNTVFSLGLREIIYNSAQRRNPADHSGGQLRAFVTDCSPLWDLERRPTMPSEPTTGQRSQGQGDGTNVLRSVLRIVRSPR